MTTGELLLGQCSSFYHYIIAMGKERRFYVEKPLKLKRFTEFKTRLIVIVQGDKNVSDLMDICLIWRKWEKYAI